jgi:hypothetical protein
MGPKASRPSPEELARRSVARLESAPCDRVRAVFRVALTRATAEALSAEAIRREVNIITVVEEILETVGAKLNKRAG